MLILCSGAPHTATRYYDNDGGWQRIEAQIHISFFAAHEATNPSMPEFEGDIFFVIQPDGSYREMRSEERYDPSGFLTRALEGVEMGEFNFGRNSRERNTNRGILRRASDVAEGNHLLYPPGESDVHRSSRDLSEAIENLQRTASAPEPLYTHREECVDRKDAISTSDVEKESLFQVVRPSEQLVQSPTPQPRYVQSTIDENIRVNSWATLARGSLVKSSPSMINIASTRVKPKWRKFDV